MNRRRLTRRVVTLVRTVAKGEEGLESGLDIRLLFMLVSYSFSARRASLEWPPSREAMPDGVAWVEWWSGGGMEWWVAKLDHLPNTPALQYSVWFRGMPFRVIKTFRSLLAQPPDRLATGGFPGAWAAPTICGDGFGDVLRRPGSQRPAGQLV